MEKILLLINDDDICNYLQEQLGSYYGITLELSQDFDLCIFDKLHLFKEKELILQKREAAEPIFLPVIAVIDKMDLELMRKYTEKHVDDFLIKPVSELELMVRLRSLLKTRMLTYKLFNLEKEKLFENTSFFQNSFHSSNQISSTLQKLQHKQHLLTETQRITHTGTWEYPVELAPLIEWSDEMYRIFEFDRERIIPSTKLLLESIHPDDRESMQKWLTTTMNGNLAGVLNFRIILPDGTQKYIRGDGRPVFNENGDLVGAIGTAQDITDQKLAENLIIQERNLSNQIIESLPGIFYLIKQNGKFLRWNKHFEMVTGYTADEISAIHPLDLFEEKNKKVAIKAAKQAFKLGYSELETNLLLKNKQIIPYTFSARPIECQNGNCLLGIGFDISERKKTETALIESETRLRLFIEHAPAALAMFDLNMRYLAVSQRWITDYHLEKHKINGSSHYDIFPEIPDYWKSIHRRGMKGDIISTEEDRFIRTNGTVQWLRWEVRPWYTVSGNVGGIVIFTEDITDRKLAQMQLAAERERLAVTLRSIGDGVIATDTSDRVILINKAAEKLTGWPQNEANGKSLNDIFNIINEPNNDNLVTSEMGADRFDGNHLLLARNGHKTDIADRSEPIIDDKGNQLGMVLVFKDITERRKHEISLQSSLHQKEILLQELYHRTKNNMQVISSLLELQAVSSENPQIEQIIKDSQLRIRAMSLAHEKLYKSRSLSQVSMKEYIIDLTQQLMSGYGMSSEKISWSFDIENITMLIDIAIPCGLIINELVSNSLKYAFPHARKGKINISLHRKGNNLVQLIIADNGVGLPPDFEFSKSKTLGISLVYQIVTHQLHGSVKNESDGGVRWFLLLRSDIYKERV